MVTNKWSPRCPLCLVGLSHESASHAARALSAWLCAKQFRAANKQGLKNVRVSPHSVTSGTNTPSFLLTLYTRLLLDHRGIIVRHFKYRQRRLRLWPKPRTAKPIIFAFCVLLQIELDFQCIL
jgi:hypothetical protein